MPLKELLDLIRETLDCEILPPAGLPVLQPASPPVVQHLQIFPDDLLEFYELCGGVHFYTDRAHYSIVSPDQVKLANPVLIPGMTEEMIASCADDISWSWYLIASDGSNYLTIDLHPQRLGRCYDSFFDRHAGKGDCPIIAHSFTELLEHLYEYPNSLSYWEEEPTFLSLGDAYDDVEAC